MHEPAVTMEAAVIPRAPAIAVPGANASAADDSGSAVQAAADASATPAATHAATTPATTHVAAAPPATHVTAAAAMTASAMAVRESHRGQQCDCKGN
jgi:hypothetical protein